LQISTSSFLLLPDPNHIRDIPKMIVVVVVSGVRNVTTILGDDSVPGIHIKAGFGSAFQIDSGADINRKSFQESNHGAVNIRRAGKYNVDIPHTPRLSDSGNEGLLVLRL
jgi:hypothetical protein